MAAKIYVNSTWTSGQQVTIDGVEYTVGVDAFTSFEAAVKYAVNNDRNATIIVEKTTSVSGNCVTQNESSKNSELDNLTVIVKGGVILGDAASKLNVNFVFTVEAGAVWQTARGSSSGGVVHLQDTLNLVGDKESGKYATIEMGKYNGYRGLDFATLYNGKIVADYAKVTVRDLGLTGAATFTDSIVNVEGALSTGLGMAGKLTLTGTEVRVKGHNNLSNPYFKNFNQLKYVTMTNSSITIDDGADGTVAAKVELNSVTMTDSDITVEAGTAVKVAGTLTLKGASTLTAGVVDMAKNVTMDSTSTLVVSAISGAGTLTVNVVDGTFGVNKIIDFAGDNGSLEGLNIVINKAGYTALIKEGDIFLASALYVGDAPEGVPAGDVYSDIISAINAADGRSVIVSGKIDVDQETAEAINGCDNISFAAGTLLLLGEGAALNNTYDNVIVKEFGVAAELQDGVLDLSADTSIVAENIDLADADLGIHTGDTVSGSAEIRSDVSAKDVTIENGKTLAVTGSVSAANLNITNNSGAVIDGGSDDFTAKFEADETISFVNDGHAVVDLSATSINIQNNSVNTITNSVIGYKDGVVSAETVVIDTAENANGVISNSQIGATSSVGIAGQSVTGTDFKTPVLNIYGDSTFGENNSFVERAAVNFGSKEDAVNAVFDVTGSQLGSFVAQNGTVTFTGKMSEDFTHGSQLAVGGTLNNLVVDTETGATTVNIGSEDDADALFMAHQVIVSHNDATAEHTLNVFGKLNADAAFMVKPNGNLNVYGTVVAMQLQGAGNVLVSGSNASITIDGNNAAYGIKIGTDKADTRSSFIIENNARVDSNLLMEVGYNNTRHGDLIIRNGGALKVETLAIQDGSTITIDAGSFTGGVYRALDLNMSGDAAAAIQDKINITGVADGVDVIKLADGDILFSTVDTSVVYADNGFGADDIQTGDKVAEGKFYGINAFADANGAAAAALNSDKLVVEAGADLTYTANPDYFLNAETAEIEGGWNYDVVDDAANTFDMQLDGTFKSYQILLNNAETVVSTSGKLLATGEALRIMGGSITVNGSRAADADAPETSEIFEGSWGGGTRAGSATQIGGGYLTINQDAVVDFNDTVVFIHAGWMNVDNATADFTNTYIYMGSGGSYAPVSVVFANGAEVSMADNTALVNDNTFTMNITIDATSTLTLDADSFIQASTLTVAEGGKFIIDATGFTGYKKVVDLNGNESLEGKVTITGDGVNAIYGADGDITLLNVDTSTLYVSSEYSGETGDEVAEGKFYGINAFSSFDTAVNNAYADTTTVKIDGDTVVLQDNMVLKGNLNIVADAPVTINGNRHCIDPEGSNSYSMTIGKNISIVNALRLMAYESVVTLDGNYQGEHLWTFGYCADENNMTTGLNINSTAKVVVGTQLEFRGGLININGTVSDTAAARGNADQIQLLGTTYGAWGGSSGYAAKVNMNNTYVKLAQNTIGGSAYSFADGYGCVVNMTNSIYEISGEGVFSVAGNGYLKAADNSIIYINPGAMTAANNGLIELNGSKLYSASAFTNSGTVTVDGGMLDIAALNNKGTVEVKGESTLTINTLSGSSIDLLDGAIIKDSTVGGAVYVAGDVVFRGKNVISQLTDFGTYYADTYGANAKWTVEKGASLELSSIYGLGYGDNANVIGSLTDAKAAYEAGLTKDDASLIINNSFVTQNNSAGKNTTNYFNVTDAYVRISKEGADQSLKSHDIDNYGKYEFNFTNSVIDTNAFNFNYAENGGTYDFTVTNSVFESGMFRFETLNSTFLADNSIIKSTGNINSVGGNIELTNNSEFIAAEDKTVVNGGSVKVENSKFTAAELNNGAKMFEIKFASKFDANKNITIKAVDADGNVIENSDVSIRVSKNDNAVAVVINGKAAGIIIDGMENDTYTATCLGTGVFEVSGSEGSTLNIGSVVGDAIQAASGATLIDSTVGGKIVMQGDLTFKGENNIKTISATNGGTLTVEDGETLVLNNFSFGTSANKDAEYLITGGTITAAYGFFQHGTYTLESDFETGYMYYSYGSNITVKGTFHSQGAGDGLDYVRGNLTIADGGQSIHEKALWVGQPPESWGEMHASLTVDAGGYLQAATFNVYNGSSALISGSVKANAINNTGSITITAATGTVEAATLTGNGTITIDAADFTGINKIIDLSGNQSLEGKVNLINGEGMTLVYGADGDVILTDAGKSTIYVNSEWANETAGTEIEAGKVIGVNAVSTIDAAAGKIALDGSNTTIKLESDLTTGSVEFKYGDGDITFTADTAVTVNGRDMVFVEDKNANIYIGENVTFNIVDNNTDFVVYYGASLHVSGTVTGGVNWGSLYLFEGEGHSIESTGTVSIARVQLGFTDLTVNGDANSDRETAHIDTKYLLVEGSTFTANNAIINVITVHDSNNGGMRYDDGASEFYINDSEFIAGSVTLQYADSVMNFDGSNATISTFTNAADVAITDSTVTVGTLTNTGSFSVDSSIFTVITSAAGAITVSGNSTLNGAFETINITKGANVAGNISGEVIVDDVATLTADFDGVLNGSVKITTSESSLNIDDASDATLIISDGVSFTADDDYLGNAVIKAENANAEISVDDVLFNGNTFTDGKLNITGVDLTDGEEEINLVTDITKISKINDMLIKNVMGVYMFNDADDVQYQLMETENGFKVVKADESDFVIEDMNNTTINSDCNLGNVSVETVSGTTQFTVVNGNANDRMEMTFGSLDKSELGGTNHVVAGNYTDVTIHNDVKSAGNIVVGAYSGFTVGGTIYGQNLNQQISIGYNANVETGDILFKGGYDTIAVGSTSTVRTGKITGVSALTVCGGNTSTRTDMIVNGDYTASETNNTINIQNYAGLTINNGNLTNGGINSGTYSNLNIGYKSALTVDGNIDGILNFYCANESTIEVGGKVEGTFYNDVVTVGYKTTFSAGSLNLANGNNTLNIGQEATFALEGDLAYAQSITVGHRATAVVGGDVKGVQRLVTVNGVQLRDGVAYTTFSAGNFTGTAGNDLINVGAYSKVELDEVDLGSGYDTIIVNYGAKLELESADGVETFNAVNGSVVTFDNGSADVNLDAVNGGWYNAEINDISDKVLEAGEMALTGDVYACEWELFQVDSNVGSLQFAGQDVKIMYSTDGCETWNTYSKMGEAIAITAGDNNWVKICVTEGFDVRDKKDKESFTVTATLA